MGFQGYTVGSAPNGGTINLPVPTGTVDGDTLIAVFCHVSPGISPNLPAGWTTKATLNQDPNLDSQAIVCTRTASSEPASYTWTLADNYMLAVMLRYTSTGAFIQSLTSTRTSGTLPQTETTPGISPAVASARVVYIYSAFLTYVGTTGPRIPTASSGLTQRAYENVGGATNAQLLAVYDEFGAGAARTVTFDNGAGDPLAHISCYLAFGEVMGSDRWSWGEYGAANDEYSWTYNEAPIIYNEPGLLYNGKVLTGGTWG